MKSLKSLVHVGAVILSLCICRYECYPQDREEVIFFDDTNYQGNKLFITLAPGCYSMESDWDNNIVSVETNGHCIIAYEFKQCHGDSVKLAPGVEEAKDLRRLKFNHEISSIRKCVEAKHGRRNRGRENDDKQLDIWVVGLEEHNKYRRMHGVPDLKSAVDLHEEAQGHADYLARNNKFELSEQTEYGENLATSYKKDKLDALREVITRWYDKIEFYNFRDPESNKNNPKSGQFSSIVWKETTHLGIGVAWNEKDKKWIVCAMYSPPATMNRYGENVPPPTKALQQPYPSVYRTRNAMGNIFRPSRYSSYEIYA